MTSNTSHQQNAIDAATPRPAAKTHHRTQPVDSVPLFKRKRLFIPLVLIAAAVMVAGIYWFLTGAGMITTDDAYVDGNRVTISSKYVGRIAELTVDEGSPVKKGQVLVRLDDSDLTAQRDQARANLVYAQRNVELARVNANKAEEDYRRADMQFKDNVIPREQYDHAKKALEAARAQRAIAEAQVGTARAQLGVVQTQLDNTVIVSPMDGVVAKRWALPGDVVQMAQPILAVYDLDHLWVTANLEETKFAAVKLNQKAYISVDSLHGPDLEGKVIQRGANTAAQFSLLPPNNASGNFTKVTQRIPIKISLEPESIRKLSPGSTLLPGMSVEVRMKTRA